MFNYDLLKEILNWRYPYKPIEGRELSWKDSAISIQQRFIKELLKAHEQKRYDKIKEMLGELHGTTKEVSG